jgi:uncharacterized protein (TIRG00374 family)
MSGTSGLLKKPSFLKNNFVRSAAGYLIAVAALYWVFHDIDLSALSKDISNVNWPLAFFGVFVDIGRYITQSVRWNLLIRPLGKISLFKTFQALYAGIFLNLILPLRVGEVARAYLASRFSGVRFSGIVSSMFIEYLIDGIWLALGIGVIALIVPLPGDVMLAARILGVLVLAAIGLFVFLLAYQKKASSEGNDHPGSVLRKPLRFLFSFLDTIRTGFRVIGTSGLFWVSLFVSALDIMFHIVAFWIIMMAYGINIPFIAAAAILLFVFVGLIIPNAPSNVGSFQFLCVLGLLAFGVEKTAASGFSALFFILVLLPQALIGFIAFVRSGERLFEVKNHLASLRLSMKEKQV